MPYKNQYYPLEQHPDFKATKMQTVYYAACILAAALPLQNSLTTTGEKIVAILTLITALGMTFLVKPVAEQLKKDGDQSFGNGMHHLIAEAINSKANLLLVFGGLAVSLNQKPWEMDSDKLHLLIAATVGMQFLRIAYARYLMQREYLRAQKRAAFEAQQAEHYLTMNTVFPVTTSPESLPVRSASAQPVKRLRRVPKRYPRR